MQARGKAAQNIQQAEEQKRAREIAGEIAQGKLKHSLPPTEQQNETASNQPIQQRQVDNNLQHSHPRPQPQPPLVQSQPPFQQQPPLQQYGYPAEYPPSHGHHHPMHQYPPHPLYPQPQYGEYPPPRPQPPYDQHLPQYSPYGYQQHPSLQQFQPAYAQYPHGHQPPYLPYLPYGQPNSTTVYQQAPDQAGCVFHMPPEEHYVAQTNGVYSQPPQGHSQVHPEYGIQSNTNIAESGAPNKRASSNHPEEILEPMVTQFNDFKISNNAEEVVVRDQSSAAERPEMQWPAIYLKIRNAEWLNGEIAKLREIASNQEAAETAINIAITVVMARASILRLFSIKSNLPHKHIQAATKIQKTLKYANGALWDLIKNIGTMDELKNFATLNQLMFKAATIYQKLGQLGSTKNNALNEMLELVQEMKVRLYAEWERFKPSNTSYFPQLKIK